MGELEAIKRGTAASIVKTPLEDTRGVVLPSYEALPSLVLPEQKIKSEKNKPEIADHRPYILAPASDIHCVNNVSPFPVISINGMNMTDEAIRNMGQRVADLHGRSTLVIPNHTEGVPIDIRNCVVSAFSNSKGLRFEENAAKNLSETFVSRLHDSYPVEISAYSQGTLITHNVLGEFKKILLNNDKADLWNAFAERVELRTYGAAIHHWPTEIKVNEVRHLSDPVSVIGDVVSLNRGVVDSLSLSFELKRTAATTLVQKKEAHSINMYMDNKAAFVMKAAGKLSLNEQANALVQSMNKGEFSNAFYEGLITQLHQTATNPSSSVNDSNSSIILSRELILGLFHDRKAFEMITRDALATLEATAEIKLQNPNQKISSALNFRTK